MLILQSVQKGGGSVIYTVTFNPSLDYIMTVPDFQMGATNRTTEEKMFPGGKGVNVSLVLKNLGMESTALGFKAGFVGAEISRRLEEMGCITDFTDVKEGNSRINVKFKNYEGTEINGSGPEVSGQELKELLDKIYALSDGDVLILAGSIPASVPDDVYKKILEHLANRHIYTAVDATKELLVNVLEYHPFLIKPNRDELGEIFSVTIQSREDILHYAKKLQEMGARNVLVSMAGDGALLLAENGEIHETKALRGTLVNGVGAGDSMVAGFMAGWLSRNDYKHAFQMGVAAGSASAFSENLAVKEDVEKLLEQFEM